MEALEDPRPVKASRADFYEYMITDGNWTDLFATAVVWMLLDFTFCKPTAISELRHRSIPPSSSKTLTYETIARILRPSSRNPVTNSNNRSPRRKQLIIRPAHVRLLPHTLNPTLQTPPRRPTSHHGIHLHRRISGQRTRNIHHAPRQPQETSNFRISSARHNVRCGWRVVCHA